MDLNKMNKMTGRRKQFTDCVRRLTVCPQSLVSLCERNFLYECSKIAKITLLSKKHLKQPIFFDGLEFEFLGFFDNYTCLIKTNSDYYQCNMYFVQDCLNLKYIDLNNGCDINYKTTELVFENKKLRRLINIDYI